MAGFALTLEGFDRPAAAPRFAEASENRPSLARLYRLRNRPHRVPIALSSPWRAPSGSASDQLFVRRGFFSPCEIFAPKGTLNTERGNQSGPASARAST